MHYYIDGYNLLFRILRTGDDLRKQREDLITDLAAKVSKLNLDVTLVFDSQYQPDGYSRSHLHQLEIIFTAAGQTADAFILQQLKEVQNAAQHTVVTSDKMLAYLCKLRLAKTESIEEFIGWLNKRYKNKRQDKGKAKQPQALLHSKPAEAKKTLVAPPSTPGKKISAEECFNYYLNTFEEQSKLLENLTSKKEKKKNTQSLNQFKKNTSHERLISSEEKHLSETQRWLRLFEQDRE